MSFDGERHRDRNTVERCINKIKAWRDMATRYGKTPDSYMAGLQLRGSLIWIRSLRPATWTRLQTPPNPYIKPLTPLL